jgi:hypothetical protein
VSGRGQHAAEESCRIRRVLFQNGRATSVELTDAEPELTRARMDLLGVGSGCVVLRQFGRMRAMTVDVSQRVWLA